MHSPQGSSWTRAPLLATDAFFGKQSAQLEKERTTPQNGKVV
jgi:hypothetical protein